MNDSEALGHLQDVSSVIYYIIHVEWDMSFICTWVQAVAPVKVIKTSAGHHLTPSVQGIVKKLTVHATTAGLKQIGP